MMHKQSNTPKPDDLLLSAREALKAVLRDPDSDHSYTILMAMNAMGIAARAFQASEPGPARPDKSDAELKSWIREADEAAILDPGTVTGLRRLVESKLAVSNPRFKPERSKDKP
ncbi:MAG: hypothetical protein WB783_05515 [Arenicellales bacterium]|jgi:hypothetical protein